MDLVARPDSPVYHRAGTNHWFKGAECGVPRGVVPIDSTDGRRPCHRCDLPERPAPVVYFAWVTWRKQRVVKIGCTRDIRRRIPQLPIDKAMSDPELIGYFPGGFDVEHDTHERFAHLRLDAKAEVFRPEPELEQFMLATIETEAA